MLLKSLFVFVTKVFAYQLLWKVGCVIPGLLLHMTILLTIRKHNTCANHSFCETSDFCAAPWIYRKSYICHIYCHAPCVLSKFPCRLSCWEHLQCSYDFEFFGHRISGAVYCCFPCCYNGRYSNRFSRHLASHKLLNSIYSCFLTYHTLSNWSINYSHIVRASTFPTSSESIVPFRKMLGSAISNGLKTGDSTFVCQHFTRCEKRPWVYFSRFGCLLSRLPQWLYFVCTMQFWAAYPNM